MWWVGLRRAALGRLGSGGLGLARGGRDCSGKALEKSEPALKVEGHLSDRHIGGDGSQTGGVAYTYDTLKPRKAPTWRRVLGNWQFRAVLVMHSVLIVWIMYSRAGSNDSWLALFEKLVEGGAKAQPDQQSSFFTRDKPAEES